MFHETLSLCWARSSANNKQCARLIVCTLPLPVLTSETEIEITKGSLGHAQSKLRIAALQMFWGPQISLGFRSARSSLILWRLPNQTTRRAHGRRNLSRLRSGFSFLDVGECRLRQPGGQRHGRKPDLQSGILLARDSETGFDGETARLAHLVLLDHQTFFTTELCQSFIPLQSAMRLSEKITRDNEVTKSRSHEVTKSRSHEVTKSRSHEVIEVTMHRASTASLSCSFSHAFTRLQGCDRSCSMPRHGASERVGASADGKPRHRRCPGNESSRRVEGFSLFRRAGRAEFEQSCWWAAML